MRLSNVSQLINSSVIYGLGGALNRALSFIALPFIARHLTPGDYGVISMLAMMGMILSSLFSLGLGTSIGARYFGKETAAEKEGVIFGALAVLTASSLVMDAVGVWYAGAISHLLFHSDENSGFVKISIVTAALGIVMQPWQLKLQFEQRAKRFVAASFGSSLVSFLLIILFVVVLERSVSGYVYALLLGQLATVFLFFVLAKGRTFCMPTRSDMKALLVQGVPLIPSFVFLFIIQNAARYPLQNSYGLEAVGIFTMGTTIGMAMSLFVNAFSTAWVPFALGFMNRQEMARHLLARLTQYYLVVFGYLTLLFFFFAKPVVILILPPSFESTYQIIGIAAAAQFFLGLFTVLLPSLYFAKKLYAVTVLQGAVAALSGIMFVTIIPMYGVFGAAFAVTLGNLLLALLLLAWITKDPDCNKIDYQLKKMAKALGYPALLALLPLLIDSENWLLNFGYGLLCAAISAWIMLRLGEMTLSDIKLTMRQVLRRE